MHSAHSDLSPQHPADTIQRVQEAQDVEVESKSEGLLGQKDSPDTGAELEPPGVIPTPSSGKNIFCFASLKI